MIFSVLSEISSSVPGSTGTGEPKPENVGDFFSELIDTIVNFFKVNGVSLVIRVLAALLLIVVGHFLVKLLDKIIVGFMRAGKRRKGKTVDMSMVTFISSCLKFILNLILVFLVLSVLRIPLDNLFSILSAAVLAIGLALQDLLANFANGVVLLTSHHFKTGDHIEVAGIDGVVEEMNMLTTVLRSFDAKRIVIPNSTVAKEVIVNNSAETTRRVTIDVGVAYGTDIAVARTAMLMCAKQDKRVLDEPLPVVNFSAYEASSVTVTLKCWVGTSDYWDTLFSLNEQIYDAFNRYGIEIAFPQMDIHLEQRKSKKTVSATGLKEMETAIRQSEKERAKARISNEAADHEQPLVRVRKPRKKKESGGDENAKKN